MRPPLVKTTVELPEELLRRLKHRSAQRGQQLKETMTEALEKGLMAMTPQESHELPPVIKSLDGQPFTLEEIQQAKEEGRL